MRSVRGFTLLELLVVVAILAAVAGIGWGVYGGVAQDAADELGRIQAQQLVKALRQFRADTGFYPGEGPFVLTHAAATVTETTAGSGQFNCSGVAVEQTGLLRHALSWLADADRDAWLASPANAWLLLERPRLCANHPLASLAHWDTEARRGWRGPYLSQGQRLWLAIGGNLQRNGDGDPTAGGMLRDIPALAAGIKQPPAQAVDANYSPCNDPSLLSCALVWRTQRSDAPGHPLPTAALARQGRPLTMFDIPPDRSNPAARPRVVYWGRDGKYGGSNAADACLPNSANPYGADDVVLCLE